MRSERPLGTWCGYKRTGEAHGETEKKPALVVGAGKEGGRNNFSNGGDDYATAKRELERREKRWNHSRSGEYTA